jgi:hypothetical protein
MKRFLNAKKFKKLEKILKKDLTKGWICDIIKTIQEGLKILKRWSTL